MSGKITYKVLIFLLTITFAMKGFANYVLDDQKAVDLNEVKTALRAYGNPWQAGENWVSRMSVADVKRMLGAQNVPNPDFQFRAKEPIARDSKVFDWRSVNGQNWISPVLNQGNCGSCVAFATIGTLESQMNISSKLPTLMPRLSPQALFACGGGTCDRGWQPGDASKFLQNTGVPDSACLPYTSGATGLDVQCNTACSDIAARSVKTVASTTKNWTFGSQTLIKNALQHGPLETTLAVYADFIAYKSGVYKHVTGAELGGHAVSIVGYDDVNQAWIIRNSWGPEWGENGFIRIAYSDTSGIGMQTWGFNLPTEDGYVAFDTPSDRQVLTGVTNLKIASTVDASSSFSYTILDSTGRSVENVSFHGVPESISFDTTTLKDGKYEIFGAAVTPNNTTVKSLHVEFYVLNGKETGSLAITPEGFDPSKPVKDRIVFDVSAPSTPVPYSTLHLHVQQNGQDVFTNVIDTVLPTMTFGWRTNMGPNGTYDVFMTADTVVNGASAFHSESGHMTLTVAN